MTDNIRALDVALADTVEQLQAATHVGEYVVPVDPMDDNQCDSCQ